MKKLLPVLFAFTLLLGFSSCELFSDNPLNGGNGGLGSGNPPITITNVTFYGNYPLPQDQKIYLRGFGLDSATVASSTSMCVWMNDPDITLSYYEAQARCDHEIKPGHPESVIQGYDYFYRVTDSANVTTVFGKLYVDSLDVITTTNYQGLGLAEQCDSLRNFVVFH